MEILGMLGDIAECWSLLRNVIYEVPLRVPLRVL